MTETAQAQRADRPKKSKQGELDADGVPMFKRPMQFSRLLRLLGPDRKVMTIVGGPGDPRRLRITLSEMTGG